MNIKTSLLLFFVLMLAGCAGQNYAEVSVGYDLGSHYKWEGGSENTTLTLGREFSDGKFCRITHVSHLLAGKPFNKGKSETWYNELACGLRVNL